MRRARLFLASLLIAIFCAASVAQADTYAYSPQFVDSSNNALVGVTVRLYNHGSAEIPANVVAQGITNSTGYLQPAATLTVGSIYDFTTSSAKVPLGQFTATAPRQLVLIPGPAGPTGAPGPPQNLVPESSNVTINQPLPNTFGIAVSQPTPAPTASPVSVRSGANTIITTPSPGVFVVNAVTPAPPTLSAGPGISIGNPTPNSYVISSTGGTVTNVTGDGKNVSVTNGTTTPQVKFTDSPNFPGRSTLGVPGTYGDNSSGLGVLSLANGTGIGSQYTDLLSSSNSNNAVNGVQGRVLALSDENGDHALGAWDIDGSYSAYGPLYSGTLTAGNCLQAAANGKIVSTASACGTGSGTVTSVGGGSNIVIGGTATAPTVATTNSPTYTGVTTIGAAGASAENGGGQLAIGNGTGVGPQLTYLRSSTSAGNNVQGVTGSVLSIYDANGSSDQFALDPSGDLGLSGYLASGTLTSGNCLQAGASGRITSTSSACAAGTVTSVGGGSNTSIGGTAAAPTVSVISAPIFPGRVTSDDPTVAFYTGINNQTRSYVAQNTVSGAGNSNLGPAPSVTIAGVNANVWNFSEYDGNVLNNNLAAIDNNGNFGIKGSYASAALTAGNCVQAGTNGKLVSSSAGCAFTMSGGSTLAGTHIETISSVSVPAGGTYTYTIPSAYNAIPVCTAVTIGSIVPSIAVSGVTTTQVILYNSAATAVNAEAICVGW